MRTDTAATLSPVIWYPHFVQAKETVRSLLENFPDDCTQDIWEVRVQSGSDTIRLMGFLFGSRSLVLTNGFAKKTAKVPVREIALAEQRRRDYLSRSKNQ